MLLELLFRIHNFANDIPESIGNQGICMLFIKKVQPVLFLLSWDNWFHYTSRSSSCATPATTDWWKCTVFKSGIKSTFGCFADGLVSIFRDLLNFACRASSTILFSHRCSLSHLFLLFFLDFILSSLSHISILLLDLLFDFEKYNAFWQL